MGWYVYILGTSDPREWNEVKIGRGDPLSRLRTARVWRSEDVRILAKQRTYDDKRLERRIKDGLRRSRVRGEVFRRSEEVERFLRVFRRSRNSEIEIYVARLLREERCQFCEDVIDLESPIINETYESGRRMIRCHGCRQRHLDLAARESARLLDAVDPHGVSNTGNPPTRAT